MRLKNLKYVLLLILLGYVTRVKVRELVAPGQEHKSVRFYFSEAKNLAQDNQDEVPKFKRKYKAKGLQVIAPLLTSLTFKTFRLRSEISFIAPQETCSSFLYCARHKRGPPALIS
jgi:hypothetical protein